MNKIPYIAFIMLISTVVSALANNDDAIPPLSEEEAIKIISTFEQINERHYKVVHMIDGSTTDKDGFRHLHAKRILFFGKKAKADIYRNYRSITMIYSKKYGWFLQRTAKDAQGFHLEISSQTQGRVYVRP